MIDETDRNKIADITLERVRRLEASVDQVKQKLAAQDQKLDALIDLASGTRADFAGFMKLYSSQEKVLVMIEKRLGRLETRSDLRDEGNGPDA